MYKKAASELERQLKASHLREQQLSEQQADLLARVESRLPAIEASTGYATPVSEPMAGDAADGSGLHHQVAHDSHCRGKHQGVRGRGFAGMRLSVHLSNVCLLKIAWLLAF